jgi:hypothetical protein
LTAGVLPPYRTVCVARDKQACVGVVGSEYHSIDDFYRAEIRDAELASFKNALGCSRQGAPSQYCQAATSDSILIALHVATREQANWVWATFWWHDRPTLGPYAEGRPESVTQKPWDHYLSNVSYDMDEPREPDGQPHIAFNPWLEGQLKDGTSSNCMTCHRRSIWNRDGESCFQVVRSDGTLIQDSNQRKIVVRGARAATATYLNEPFEKQLKLGFLWSLQLHSVPQPPRPSCAKP